jgi:hypothetical protein
MRFYAHWSDDVMSYEIKDHPQDPTGPDDRGYATELEAWEACEASLAEWTPVHSMEKS